MPASGALSALARGRHVGIEQAARPLADAQLGERVLERGSGLAVGALAIDHSRAGRGHAKVIELAVGQRAGPDLGVEALLGRRELELAALDA